jgi:hypothetical protein
VSLTNEAFAQPSLWRRWRLNAGLLELALRSDARLLIREPGSVQRANGPSARVGRRACLLGPGN